MTIIWVRLVCVKIQSLKEVYVKKILSIGFMLIAASLYGCTKQQTAAPTSEQNQAAATKTFKVGVIFDKAGKDDKSFNNSAFVGATKAEKELGIELKTVEPSDDNAYEPAMDQFASRNYDLIIAIGFIQEEALKKVAARYPNSKFAIVDSIVDLPNISSLMFEEHEGSYLAGMIAAMKTKSNVIGFVGGMDIPLIRRFALGYKSGAQAVNPKITVKENYIGITVDAFNDPTKAKELANAQISQKADVIFAAAGPSGMGVYDAIEKANILAIGVDSNQNWIKPGKILTSMLKRVDVAVYDTIKEAKEGQFKPGTRRFSLKDQGIDVAMDEHNKNLITPEMLSKVEQAKQDIIAGKIQVPDYYKMKK